MYPGAIWEPDAGFMPPAFGTTAARLAYVLRPGECVLDFTSGQMFVGDGVTPGGRQSLPLIANVPANSLIPQGYSAYVPGGLQIPVGVTYEIAAGAVLEVS
jgi:hypothetical protein